MQRFLLSVLFIFTLSVGFAQSQYEVLKDYVDGGKILKGVISKDILASDSSFKWYSQNLKPYSGSKEVPAVFAKHKDSVQLVIFFGTWCEDSHFVIPKLFSLMDAAGFPQDRITLLGVDRKKTTLSHLSEALNVTKVPTIIVMKNGIELGRFVDFGKYGLFDMELAEILKAIE